jgi:hypothetical protein
MKKIMSIVVSVACSLCVVNSVYAQQKNTPVPTGTAVAEIRCLVVSPTKARITTAMPALMDTTDFREISYENSKDLNRKLARFVTYDASRKSVACDSAGIARAFEGVDKTVPDWFTAMRDIDSDKGNRKVSEVTTSGLYVITQVPRYAVNEYGASMLSSRDNPVTQYVPGGFNGDLNVLREQALRKVTIKGLNVDSAQVRSSKGQVVENWISRHPGEVEVALLPQAYKDYSGLGVAQVNELYQLIITKKCPVVAIEHGAPYAKNTGVGITSEKKYYNGKRYEAARCQLSNGQVIDILRDCTNVAYPLMGIQYAFDVEVTPPTVVVAGPGPKIPTVVKAGIPVALLGLVCIVVCRGHDHDQPALGNKPGGVGPINRDGAIRQSAVYADDRMLYGLQPLAPLASVNRISPVEQATHKFTLPPVVLKFSITSNKLRFGIE